MHDLVAGYNCSALAIVASWKGASMRVMQVYEHAAAGARRYAEDMQFAYAETSRLLVAFLHVCL